MQSICLLFILRFPPSSFKERLVSPVDLELSDSGDRRYCGDFQIDIARCAPFKGLTCCTNGKLCHLALSLTDFLILARSLQDLFTHRTLPPSSAVAQDRAFPYRCLRRAYQIISRMGLMGSTADQAHLLRPMVITPSVKRVGGLLLL